MKYIKTFEYFDSNINEWLIPSRAKEIEKQRIMDEIEDAISVFIDHPENFVEYDENKLREELLKSAVKNGYRGEIEIRQSADDPKSANPNKHYIIYSPKSTTLQDLGSAAGRGIRG